MRAHNKDVLHAQLEGRSRVHFSEADLIDCTLITIYFDAVRLFHVPHSNLVMLFSPNLNSLLCNFDE